MYNISKKESGDTGGEKMHKKKILWLLSGILVVGLLIHSAILLYINKNFDPVYVTGANITKRLLLRKAAESVFSICGTGYIIGNIIFVYQLIKKHLFIPFHLFGRYFVSQLILMILCTIPFAVFDLVYFEDYIFPIWGTAGTLFIVLLIAFVIGLHKKEKEGDII